MSSVSSTEKCRICGGVKHTDFNCKTFEEWELCQKCGYSLSYQAILTEENGEYILDENGKRTYRLEEDENPCGACYFTFKDGTSKFGPLSNDTKEEDVLGLFNLRDNSIFDLDESYIYYRNPETGEFKLLFGNKEPESYEEWEEKMKKVSEEIFGELDDNDGPLETTEVILDLDSTEN